MTEKQPTKQPAEEFNGGVNHLIKRTEKLLMYASAGLVVFKAIKEIRELLEPYRKDILTDDK